METFGGWTKFSILTDEAKKVFHDVKKPLGVIYTPFAFATQVVAGINYCFLCTGEVAGPKEIEKFYKMIVFEPLPGQGELKITEIVELKPVV